MEFEIKLSTFCVCRACPGHGFLALLIHLVYFDGNVREHSDRIHLWLTIKMNREKFQNSKIFHPITTFLSPNTYHPKACQTNLKSTKPMRKNITVGDRKRNYKSVRYDKIQTVLNQYHKNKTFHTIFDGFNGYVHFCHLTSAVFWGKIYWENDRPAASHWKTFSHNVVLSTPSLKGIRTRSVNGDRHWLRPQLEYASSVWEPH